MRLRTDAGRISILCKYRKILNIYYDTWNVILNDVDDEKKNINFAINIVDRINRKMYRYCS